jgi:hypothetical protein
MTLPDLLLLPLYLLALLVPIVGVILTRAAVQQPRINFLTFTAGFVDTIAAVIVTYLFAVIDKALNYPLPLESAQIVFRVVLIALGLSCVWFFWLYRTGRFADGSR